jgi:riboflavin synthase
VATKGSVCVDGVSLTVNAVEQDAFAVGLIPHTLEVTTLDRLQSGVAVNVEVDVLARYVLRGLEHAESGASALTMETLRQAGFGFG